MPNITGLPSELLLWIVSHLDGSALFALAGSCKVVNLRLQPSIWKNNINFQNSNLLHLAARTDNIVLAKSLYQYDANINAFYRGKTPLMIALKHSSTSVCRFLLKMQELDINVQNSAHDSALWYAVHCGSISNMKSLLRRANLNLDRKDSKGRTALHQAVFWGKLAFVHLLLSRGSDPNLEDDSGHSPWAWACRFDRPLMKSMFSSEYSSRSSLGTHLAHDTALPLHQAVSYGSPDAVKLLLKRKPLHLNVQDRYGNTPLHLAIQSMCLDVVTILLNHPRINVNCKDNDGNTPLWLSTYSSCDEITDRLLAVKEIDINFVGGRGRHSRPSTSLHHAVTRLNTVTLRRLLATPGIDINVRAAGQSALSASATHGHVNAVGMLLKVEGVDINGRGLADPPICRATARGHLDVVRLLVQQGALLNINEGTVADYDTALCIAVRDGGLEMVRILLRHDQIDVNLKNRWLEDPLMLAAKGGHLSIVNELLSDRRQKCGSLRRSLDCAIDDCIRRAIREKILVEDHNLRQTSWMPSSRRNLSGLPES